MTAHANESTARPAADNSTNNRADSPLAMRHIPLTFDTTESEESARRLIDEYAPSWKAEEGEVKLVRFTDGITNTLMKATKLRPGCTELELDQDAVLIRAYGKGTDVIIDRERELRAHSLLATFGLAPPLLARFDNGFLYGYIAGHVCSAEDLRKPQIYRQTAKRLGEWHGSLPIAAITATPNFHAPAAEREHQTPFTNDQSTRPYPNTWSVLQQWIDALPENEAKERERKKVLYAECAEMSAKLGDTPGIDGKNYVFVHHDLLCGNVIVDTSSPDPDKQPVTFIDYEYATPGPAVFDIANHFAEWAGYDCQHDHVPTKSQRREFITHYVASYRSHSCPSTSSLSSYPEDTAVVPGDVDLERDVDRLCQQVDLFRGIPGLFWGVWGLIQSTISTIDFDYASYAELRLREYWSAKEEMDGSRQRDGRDMYIREKVWQSE